MSASEAGQRMNKKAVLTGFSGVGKSAVTSLLSDSYGYDILDLDNEIEKKIGQKVKEKIRVDGEKSFRQVELEVFESCLSKDFDFLALGGGALETPQIREALLKSEDHLLIYLEASLPTIIARIVEVEKKQPGLRPLLFKEEGVLEQSKLEQLYHSRLGNYNQADVRIVTDGVGIEEITATLDSIVKQLMPRVKGSTIMPANFGNGVVTHLIGKETLTEIPKYISKSFGLQRRVALFIDENVAQHYGTDLEIEFEKKEISCEIFKVPSGETSKSVSKLEHYCTQLSENGFSRKDLLIAVGGGVTGDLVGFIASVYLRGVKLIQVPSTVVAQVDSAIGGKTGVNLTTGKNLVGTFYPADVVWTDVSLLKTLPKREYVSGLAEVVKYGAIVDSKFYDWLKPNSQKILSKMDTELLEIVRVSTAAKIAVVTEDLLDLNNSRARLNFGHTIGHAIENICGYGTYLHGEAVAIGMVVAAGIGERLGFTEPGAREDITKLLEQFGLPTSLKLGPELERELLDFWKKLLKCSTENNCDMSSLEDMSQLVNKKQLLDHPYIKRWGSVIRADKKSAGKNTGYVVLEKIGKSKVEEVEVNLLTTIAALEFVNNRT
jgi:3-dehydroquinate synthase